MNPSALEDLWTVVRLAAEGSDWKRDQGETLCAWAQRRLKPSRGEATQDGPARAALIAILQALMSGDIQQILANVKVAATKHADYINTIAPGVLLGLAEDERATSTQITGETK